MLTFQTRCRQVWLKQPLRNEVCLARNHRIVQRAIGAFRVGGPRVVPGDYMVGEEP